MSETRYVLLPSPDMTERSSKQPCPIVVFLSVLFFGTYLSQLVFWTCSAQHSLYSSPPLSQRLFMDLCSRSVLQTLLLKFNTMATLIFSYLSSVLSLLSTCRLLIGGFESFFFIFFLVILLILVIHVVLYSRIVILSANLCNI